MAEILEFPRQTIRDRIDQSIAEISACGFAVTVVEDFGDRVIVDAWAGDGGDHIQGLLIDPALANPHRRFAP